MTAEKINFRRCRRERQEKEQTTSDLTITTISQHEERSIRLTNIDEQRTSVSSCYFSWPFFSARGTDVSSAVQVYFQGPQMMSHADEQHIFNFSSRRF